jgi:hypothetical protein
LRLDCEGSFLKMNPSPEQEIESRHSFGDSLSFKCHFANNLDLVGDKREWAHEYLRIVPKMRIVREHDEEVFIVLREIIA